MKTKVLALILVLMMLLTLCACGSSKSASVAAPMEEAVETEYDGSYYDADRGVDPDVFLSKTETFCDREKLAEIIRSLP